MSDVFLTLIVPDNLVSLARLVAATVSVGGEGMWTTPLSSTADGVPSHWISSGLVPPDWQYMVPVLEYAQDDAGSWVLVGSTPGNQQAVLYACEQEGVTIDPVELAALFDTADVTAQPPFVAMERLGLVLVQPVDDGE